MADDKIISKIKITLDKVRPFLQRDGGDVELVGTATLGSRGELCVRYAQIQQYPQPAIH